MKKGRLSNADRKFILENKKLKPEKIAKEVGRSIDVVKAVLKEGPKNTTPKKDHLARSADGRAVVMTEAAAGRPPKKKKKLPDPSIIFKPKG